MPSTRSASGPSHGRQPTRDGPLQRAAASGYIPRHAGIAQLVEHNLAKVGVAGSSPVSRSDTERGWDREEQCPIPAFVVWKTIAALARMAKRVDARDLKSLSRKGVPVRVWVRAWSSFKRRWKNEGEPISGSPSSFWANSANDSTSHARIRAFYGTPISTRAPLPNAPATRRAACRHSSSRRGTLRGARHPGARTCCRRSSPRR
jgi:hypothetical protein